MFGAVRPLVMSPTPSCFCQRTLPSFRSRQRSKRSLFASGLETKIESPETIGVAPENPGSGAVHRTPSVALTVSGKFVSDDDPLKAGPRQCGQSAASTSTHKMTATTKRRDCRCFIGRSIYRGERATSAGRTRGASSLKREANKIALVVLRVNQSVGERRLHPATTAQHLR